MSKAEALARHLLARLAAITLANGYATDAGLNVFWGARKIPDDVASWLVLVEPEDDVKEQGALNFDVRLRQPFTIEGGVGCDPLNPNAAGHQLVADIQRGIFSPGQLPRDLGMKIHYAGKRLVPRDDGSNETNVQVMIEVELSINLQSP